MPEESSTPIARLRFTAELCDFQDAAQSDIRGKQRDFAASLRSHFSGKVPLGSNTPPVGVDIVESIGPVPKNVVVGAVMVFLGIEDSDAAELCDAYNDPRFPYVTWELINEETELRRAEELAERREYSRQFLEKVRTSTPAEARKLVAAAVAPRAEGDDDEVDPETLF